MARQNQAIKTKRVEAFKTVMECGSVTAAARELFVTQPAVTKLLAQLQRDLGLVLFQRIKGRLTPTPEANILYQHVRQLFDALDEIGDVARDIKNLQRGNLVIGGLPLLSTSWLPLQCCEFIKPRGSVKLTLHSRSSGRIQDWVVSGQLDIGVGMIADSPLVNAELLANLEAVCILPPGHRLAERTVVTPTDFRGEKFIMTGGVDGTRQKIEGLLKALDVEVNSQLQVILSSATCSLVATGAGISLVNGFSAAEFAHLRYEIRPFRPKLCFQIYLLTPRNRAISQLARAFVEHLKMHAPQDLERTAALPAVPPQRSRR